MSMPISGPAPVTAQTLTPSVWDRLNHSGEGRVGLRSRQQLAEEGDVAGFALLRVDAPGEDDQLGQ